MAAALDAELAGRTQPDALGTRVQTLVLLADIALDRGDVQAAAAFQEQARSLLASVPAQHPFHARAARAVQRLQAELCLWQGDAACAAAEAEAAIATARDLREDPTELVQARLLHLNAVRALGDRARAEVLAAGYRDETVAFAGPCSTYTLALRACTRGADPARPVSLHRRVLRTLSRAPPGGRPGGAWGSDAAAQEDQGEQQHAQQQGRQRARVQGRDRARLRGGRSAGARDREAVGQGG